MPPNNSLQPTVIPLRELPAAELERQVDMSLLTDLVEELRSDLGVHSAEDTAAFRLLLAAPPGFSTQVVIPPEGVFEWFVTVFDVDGDKVWSDSMEHYGKDADQAELTAEMVGEIRRFFRTMAEVEDFRVSTRPAFQILGFTFGRLTAAEWLLGGEWQPVWSYYEG